jgi:hypothetical protein
MVTNVTITSHAPTASDERLVGKSLSNKPETVHEDRHIVVGLADL